MTTSTMQPCEMEQDQGDVPFYLTNVTNISLGFGFSRTSHSPRFTAIPTPAEVRVIARCNAASHPALQVFRNEVRLFIFSRVGRVSFTNATFAITPRILRFTMNPFNATCKIHYNKRSVVKIMIQESQFSTNKPGTRENSRSLWAHNPTFPPLNLKGRPQGVERRLIFGVVSPFH